MSNPTLAKAEKLIATQAEIDTLEAWTKAVESIRERLSEEQKKLTDYLYFLPSVEQETDMGELAKLLNVTRRQVYNRKDAALLEFWLVLRGD